MSASQGSSPKRTTGSPSTSPRESDTRLRIMDSHTKTPAASSSFFSDFVATPTGTMMPTKLDFQSPMPPHARLASAAMLATPAGKKALGLILLEGTTTPSLELPMSCNFDALSNHFHLPLKIAAEKFGVRATAFKKRCRAIGIRHWPYRKVRSLKRSLQELNRCRDQGLLNDKQHHQLLVFQSQLDKLLSPETYGIDPSGRLPPGTFDNDADDNDHDSTGDAEDDSASCSSNQSPRVESPSYASFTDFKITPFRTKRAKSHHPSTPTKNHLPSLKRSDFSLPSGIVTSSHGTDGAPYFRFPSERETPTPKGAAASATFVHGEDLMPSVSVRFASHNGHTGFDSYDPFFQDFKSEFTLTMEDFGGEDSGPSTYGIDNSPQDDFFPYVRSPTMAALRASSTPNGSSRRSHASSRSASSESNARTSEESNDGGDDDVFLQISPDYGCLV